MDERELLELGWREWLSLPDLDIPAIKAKIDTGARSSALHAASVAPFDRGGREWVRFTVHPARDRQDILVTAEAPVLERRVVSDSGGHRENRIFIRTRLCAGKVDWPIEINLTDRESMLFPMLLGRTAMSGRIKVVPDRSYLLGRPAKSMDEIYPTRTQRQRANKST